MYISISTYIVFFLVLRSYVCRILTCTKSIDMYVGYTDFYSVHSRLVLSPYVCMYVIQISTGYNFLAIFEFLLLRSYVCRILACTKSIGMYVGYTDFYSVHSRLVPSPYVCM
jgi:hypothetical protein